MPNQEEIFEKHAELFHYTSHEGLVGILNSRSLWATHYKFLNDTSELQIMRTELKERLFPFIKQNVVNAFRKANVTMKNKMRKAGGPILLARSETNRIVDVFYAMAFEDTASSTAMAVPFITSFCAHTTDQGYEQQNGLLSQWRGYANGGYALVFDTKKLTEFLKREGEHYYYTSSFFGDVVYHGDEEAFVEEFDNNLSSIRDGLKQFIETGGMEVGDIFADVLSMFTRLKHRGFYEEREVRVVACPMTKEIEDDYRRVDPNYVSPDLPLKTVHIRNDDAPYIELFDFDEEAQLPINRIIVGPMENQSQAKRDLEKLVVGDIEVHRSETPLI